MSKTYFVKIHAQIERSKKKSLHHTYASKFDHSTEVKTRERDRKRL